MSTKEFELLNPDFWSRFLSCADKTSHWTGYSKATFKMLKVLKMVFCSACDVTLETPDPGKGSKESLTVSYHLRMWKQHRPPRGQDETFDCTKPTALHPTSRMCQPLQGGISSARAHPFHPCLCQKPEKQCQLPWSSKHDSSSRTFWEAPPAPKRKLKHPKTHLRTRRAPFNLQVLPVTFPSNQVIQSHFTGWTSLSFKWTGAFAPRPFPNLCCLRVSNSLLISRLNIFSISSRLSVFAAARSIKARQPQPSHNQCLHNQQPSVKPFYLWFIP